MGVKNSVSEIPVDFKATLPPRKRAKTKEEKEQRRIQRILRNRRAAHQSREKKRLYVQQLEAKCELLERILRVPDLSELCAGNATLSGMVEQWKEMDSAECFSKCSENGQLDSPDSLTSSPAVKKESYPSTSCEFSNTPSESSGEHSGVGSTVGETTNNNISPCSLPFGESYPAEKEFDHYSNNYVIEQNVSQGGAPLVKIEEDSSVLFDGNDDIMDVQMDSDVTESSQGWNLLLTVPPNLNEDLSGIEVSSDLINPSGLDTWRNPAAIVT